MNTIRKILAMLTAREKRSGALVLLLIVFMGLLETIGVASVVPFLAVLGNPAVVETNPMLSAIYRRVGSPNLKNFLFLLGLASFAVTVLGAAVRIATVYAMNRWANGLAHSLSIRLLQTLLHQPYEFFLGRHSAELSTNILAEVDQVVRTLLVPVLQAIAAAVVILALTVLLVITNPGLALGAGAFIGITYSVVYLLVTGILGRAGAQRRAANAERFTAASEALGGIKEIKLLGRESVYLSRFSRPSALFARHLATSSTLTEVPKYLIEAVGVGGVLGLALVLMMATQDTGKVLPVLGLYAFAGYKLIPAAQKIYEGFARLRFGGPAVDPVYDDLMIGSGQLDVRFSTQRAWEPEREIRLDGLTYCYPNADKPALSDVDVTIPVGSSVGLVGGTGAGKTTLVDLILGLLKPTSGFIRIDGEAVTPATLRSWQNTLGYVPQDIFLTDTSIAENIALGVPSTMIDFDLVEQCARMAQIHDFIVSELPEQYRTVVGERGVRLSGGQRQRIGIARALYNSPSTLVFDEATSALDSITERAVMEAVDSVKDNKTIIIIAHRLSTVRNCDRIFLLDNGRIKACGTFDELRRTDEQFASLTKG